MKLTPIITKGNQFLIGTFKEILCVQTQGKTIEEVEENLIDALELHLEDMKDDQMKERLKESTRDFFEVVDEILAEKNN